MSILPADVHAELVQLLDALQSADNDVRTKAEEHLNTNWTAQKPQMLLMGLVEHLQGSTDVTVSCLHSPTLFTSSITNKCVLR